MNVHNFDIAYAIADCQLRRRGNVHNKWPMSLLRDCKIKKRKVNLKIKKYLRISRTFLDFCTDIQDSPGLFLCVFNFQDLPYLPGLVRTLYRYLRFFTVIRNRPKLTEFYKLNNSITRKAHPNTWNICLGDRNFA